MFTRYFFVGGPRDGDSELGMKCPGEIQLLELAPKLPTDKPDDPVRVYEIHYKQDGGGDGWIVYRFQEANDAS